jgi:transposase
VTRGARPGHDPNAPCTGPTRSERLIEKLSEPEEAEPGQIKQRDAAILRSSPGLGRTVLATLLSEATNAVRDRDYRALRCLTGTAPVTRQSGKTRYVIQRHACNLRLKNAVYHWARVAIQHDPVSRAKYDALRASGKSWGRALRTIADRLLYVVCKMLSAGTFYDPARAKIAEKPA